MSSQPQLLTIVAHARSGALDHAWALFRAAGLEGIDDDPAVLSLRGRLLKDQALAEEGEARRALYLRAADSYGRAGAISGAAYPLINAATLALLAGEAGQACARARDVIDRIERRTAQPDTPYYEAATRAEAWLLLGETQVARTIMAEAMALAPQAWEDHASTLTQFARILTVLGEDARWLDPLRPPRSLHFAGHMALAADTTATALAVRDRLEAERIGFGFGALAAGGDIVIAEALLHLGAELHLTLSAPPAAFRVASVAGQGGDWGARFDAILARAETVRWLGQAADPPHPLGVQLASETAMGQAVMHARALASEAVQLLILDSHTPDPGEAGGTAWVGAAWRATGRRQAVVLASRVKAPEPMPAAPSAMLAAILLIELSSDADDTLTGAEQLAQAALPALRRLIEDGPAQIIPTSWRGRSVQLVYATAAQAAQVALAVVAALNGLATARIAGAYGLARLEPVAPPLLLGPVTAQPATILASTPPGAVHLTETFAAALQIGPAGGRSRIEYVGDLAGPDFEKPVRLFSLKDLVADAR